MAHTRGLCPLIALSLLLGNLTVVAHAAEAADEPVSIDAIVFDPAEEAAAHTWIQQGADLTRAGNPQRAIDDYLDKAIGWFERTYLASGKAIYSAQSTEQAILYSALPQEPKREVLVVEGKWAELYLIKAYALIELGRLSDARVALEGAMTLAPMSARLVSEYAYTFQEEQNWNRAIEEYRRAADLAENWTDEALRTEELTRAWRGEGFALIELGRLDEARALYRKCLKLNRKDEAARNELKYIEQLERRQGAR